MAKEPATYQDLRKTMRRAVRIIKMTTWLINASIFLLNLSKNIDKSPVLRAITLVISTIFEVVFYFIVGHLAAAYFIALLLVLLPLILLEGLINMALYEISYQAAQYNHLNKLIREQLSERHLIKLQIGVARSVRASKKNFKRVNYAKP